MSIRRLNCVQDSAVTLISVATFLSIEVRFMVKLVVQLKIL